MRLYRDVSKVQEDQNSCVVLNSPTVLYSYTNSDRTRKTYYLVEDTYYLARTENSSYGYNHNDYECLTSSQLETMPSAANALTPIYGFICCCLALAVLGIVWYVIRSLFGRGL